MNYWIKSGKISDKTFPTRFFFNVALLTAVTDLGFKVNSYL